MLIIKRENVGLKHCNYPKAFIEYSDDVQDSYKNIDEYNPGKKQIINVFFSDMTDDMITNKTLNLTVTELFQICEKLFCFFQ